MLTILVFIGVLGLLVFVHELGHFGTAKAFGIKVTEFGFGFPPRLFGVRRGETLYSINLIPLGGFVRMVGEDDPTHPRSLAGKGVLTRFTVLVAGSAMNFLLPVVIFSILFMVPQETVVGMVTISQVVPGSPADRAGLMAGDRVLRADGHRIENTADLAQRIQLRLGSEMEWLVMRGANPEYASYQVIRVVPRWNPPEGQGPTGIMIGIVNPHTVTRSSPFWEAIPMGVRRVGEVLTLAKNEVTRWIIGKTTPQVAGPVGIAQVTGEVARSGVMPLLELTALLSINLAILNILPIPMLDGGRILFVIIEWVRRGKRISPQREALVHLMGFVVLITFVIIISYFDIVRVIQGESLLR